MSGQREALIEVLTEHDWFTPRGYAWPCCHCGEEFQGGEDEARAHLTDAILAALPEAGGEEA